MNSELPSNTLNDNKGFLLLGDVDRYNKEKRVGILPKEIVYLRNAVPRPILLSESPMHIACYVGDKNYSDPSYPTLHGGIDFQTEKGTPIIAVERAQLRVCLRPDERGLSNIQLVGIESNIYYELDHLDPDSIPPYLLERMFIEPHNPVIEAGTIIGTIGEWPYQLGEDINIPPDVENIFGRSYHHLHFETHHIPFPVDSAEFSHAMLSDERRFNPLLILRD